MTSFDELYEHERRAVIMYHDQMIEEGDADPASNVYWYDYDVRLESLEDFIVRYMDASPEFKAEYEPDEFWRHHEDTLAVHDIPMYDDVNRWPVIVNDAHVDYVLDGYHRMHSYIRDGATRIPTIRMRKFR